MRQLTVRELTAILEELSRQKLLEVYNEQQTKWAFLAAVITNGFGAIAGMLAKKRFKPKNPDDFIAKKFKQEVDKLIKPSKSWEKHINDAKSKGIWR